jgi:hypothetical protein
MVKDRRVGIVVAANSGRPGGSIGWGDGSGGVSLEHLHARHKTQEEDIVSNWLLTHAFNQCGSMVGEQQLDTTAVAVAFSGICNAWGLSSRSLLGGNTTLQGVDYTKTKSPMDYADVWTVQNIQLSCKCESVRDQHQWFDHSDQFTASLYFCAAPNVSQPGQATPFGSVARTFNPLAHSDANMFFGGVKCALRAALFAMALDKVQVVLLPLLGGGVYAGPWGDGYQGKFLDIVREVLREPLHASSCTSLSEHFVDVVIVTLS